MSRVTNDWWLKGKLIELIDRITLIDEITLIDQITLIDKITEITDIGTLAAITNILNLESIDLIDRITLIDEITTIGKIDEITSIVNIGDNVSPRPMSSRSRTGRAFFVDTFEDYYSVITEGWNQAVATIALSTDYARKGIGCTSMKLTTSAIVGDAADAALFMGAFALGKFGVEFDFMSLNGDTVRRVWVQLLLYDGTDSREGLLEYVNYVSEVANQKFRYYDSSGDPQDVPDGAFKIPFTAAYPNWQNLKLIMDFENDEYVQAILNGGALTMDLSGIALRKLGDTTTKPQLGIHIRGVTDLAEVVDLYVDNVLLTDQEP